MSSYYVDAALRKYAAAGFFFPPNGPRPSCSIGPGEDDCGSARTAACVPLLSALYGVNNAASKIRLLVTRGTMAMRREAHTLHRSLFDHGSLTESCCQPEPGRLSLAAGQTADVTPGLNHQVCVGVSCAIILKPPRQCFIPNTGILAAAGGGSINSVKPLVLHGKKS